MMLGRYVVDGTIKNLRMILEEKKALKLFIWLFYILFFSYDSFYYYIYPKIVSGAEYGIPKKGLGIWYYILVAAIFPAAVYLLKKGNLYVIKYVYLFGFILIDTINNVMIYYGNSKPFASGNIVELLFVLFTPIFVNKKYFWTVALSFIGKYAFMAIILQSTRPLLPIVIFIVLLAIAYVILTRFFSYINSLTKAYEELHEKGKLAIIGEMAAAIGHEIRNPLASLKGFTQLQNERYPNTNEFYPIMIQEIDRINLIVNDLMYLGKPKALHLEKANIAEIIAYTLSITQQQAERQNVNIETTIKGPLPPIDCDDKQLKQVFINLIKNAIESMPDGGTIIISIKVIERKKMLISIQDEGCGIPEEMMMNLGEPFYTTKKDGHGLGLMVTNQIIKDHKGILNFQNNNEKGTNVSVVLPIAQN